MTDNRRVDFNDLRRRADFRAILAHYGLSPVGKGEQVKVQCPFHPDEEPSCSVNLGKRIYHCFACQAAGNVLEFVHRMENRNGEAVTLRHAGILLAEVSGIELPGGNGAQRPKEARTAPRRVEATQTPSTTPAARPERPARPQKATGQGKEPERNKPLGFALTLDGSHSYLEERGISPELAWEFGLGYCEKGIMAGRVCIPIHNVDAQTVAYAGRWVGPVEKLPEGKGKYELPSGFRKELELFNLHRAKHCKHLVVVEGYFAAIRLHALCIPAVALMGTSVSIKQLELLAHANARHITVMLDGDEPGREAAEKVAGAIANVAWSRIVHLPTGEQPDTIDRTQLERMLGRGQG
jgi:DNA primase